MTSTRPNRQSTIRQQHTCAREIWNIQNNVFVSEIEIENVVCLCGDENCKLWEGSCISVQCAYALTDCQATSCPFTCLPASTSFSSCCFKSITRHHKLRLIQQTRERNQLQFCHVLNGTLGFEIRNSPCTTHIISVKYLHGILSILVFIFFGFFIGI